MLRWGTAAILVGQWTLCLLLTHIDTIMHLSERETVRNARVGSSIAMFYCELRRQSWDERTRQGDPSLTTIKMVEREALRVDEGLLEVARTRVGTVLRRAGLSGPPEAMPQLPPGEMPSSVQATLDAAKTALHKRGQDEVRAKGREQEELQQRLKAIRESSGDFRSSKERHQDEWERKKAERGAAGGQQYGTPPRPQRPPVEQRGQPYSRFHPGGSRGGDRGRGRGGGR